MARTQLSVETLLAELPAMTVVRPVELIGRTFPAGHARHALPETYSLTPQTVGVGGVEGGGGGGGLATCKMHMKVKMSIFTAMVSLES